MTMRYPIGLLMTCLLALGCLQMAEARRPFEVNIGRTEALVNHLEGSAHLLRGTDGAYLPLKVNDTLRGGDEVTVGAKGSRMEILLADRSLVRFADNTRFRITQIEPKGNSLNVSIDLAKGQIFANLSQVIAQPSFRITTVNAVAGVRGTIYRLNLDEHKSLLVRVYEGEVQVSKAPKTLDAPTTVGPPVRIAGPQPVPGPTRVTMEEWSHIVGAMQQITIRPDGSADEPVKFTAAEDIDEWVIWNRERDKSFQ